MDQNDTTRLLRECDAGIRMGVKSLSDAMPAVEDANLLRALQKSRATHEELARRCRTALHAAHIPGQNPNPMADAMSWLKTNMKLMMKPTDQTVAGLITDGCHMGIKSLHRYLNEYSAADTKSRALAEDVIAAESDLCTAMEPYL